jgi:uncharacterized lipoprotein YmbA
MIPSSPMQDHLPGTLARRTGWLLAGLLLGVTGCSIFPVPSANSTRYYVLTGPGLQAEEMRQGGGTLRIGLKAVEVAPYLRKPEIAVRRDANELVYDDYSRWAEPLEAGIARIVQARLLAGPAVGRVFTAPFPFDQEHDYDIALNIIRCEGVKDGRTVALFAAAVEITTGGDDAKVVARKVFQAPDGTWDGKDYAALAGALSSGVAALCDDLLAALPEKK